MDVFVTIMVDISIGCLIGSGILFFTGAGETCMDDLCTGHPDYQRRN